MRITYQRSGYLTPEDIIRQVERRRARAAVWIAFTVGLALGLAFGMTFTAIYMTRGLP